MECSAWRLRIAGDFSLSCQACFIQRYRTERPDPAIVNPLRINTLMTLNAPWNFPKRRGRRDRAHGVIVTVRHGGSLFALDLHVFIHAPARAQGLKRRGRARPRVDARDALPCGRA